MRTAIWAAVSTVSQAAPDKVSIQVQVTKGREFIASRGYQPAGEYIAPGESRTKYISLYHAEREIEPLHQLLEAASRKEFDLLFVYDLNRFRTLMRQVFDALSDYGIQLYIHTNPRDPVAPEAYNDEHKTAVGMIVDLANIISRNDISNLRRHFAEKMPGRIQRGLDARLGSIPYGYKRTHPGDKTHPLEIDPQKAAVVTQIKDLFLSGASYKAICQQLNHSGIPSPKNATWHPETIRIILSSPYYAGLVYFGITKYTRDRRTGKETRIENPAPIYNQGKHKPLWTQSTHQQILSLIHARGKGYRGNKTRRLSRLLFCFCGSKLHHDQAHTNRDGSPNPIWRCASGKPGHTLISDRKAQQLLIPAIIDHIRQNANPSAIDQHTPAEGHDTHALLTDLNRKRALLLDLYETNDIDKSMLISRIKRIQTEIDRHTASLEKAKALHARRLSRHDQITRLAKLLDKLDVYLLKAPAPQVNADLHSIIARITIQKDHSYTITRRGDE